MCLLFSEGPIDLSLAVIARVQGRTSFVRSNHSSHSGNMCDGDVTPLPYVPMS